MGQDKARLRLGKRTLSSWARETARAAGLEVRVIRKDLVARCGPLGGIYTGLRQSRSDAILFLSCDMPFITVEVLLAILDRLDPKTQAVFTNRDGHFGFPFLIRREASATVEAMIARRELSLQVLARNVQARPFRVPKKWARAVFNVNTPEEYQLARREWASSRTPSAPGRLKRTLQRLPSS